MWEETKEVSISDSVNDVKLTVPSAANYIYIQNNKFCYSLTKPILIKNLSITFDNVNGSIIDTESKCPFTNGCVWTLY